MLLIFKLIGLKKREKCILNKFFYKFSLRKNIFYYLYLIFKNLIIAKVNFVVNLEESIFLQIYK